MELAPEDVQNAPERDPLEDVEEAPF